MREATQNIADDDKELTLREHLEEIRSRLIKCVIVVTITTAISFFFAKHIFEILKSRAPENIVFVQIEVMELWAIYMKVALYCGIAFSLPFLVYQMVMFIHPALTRSERSFLYLTLPGIIILFASGILFTYFIFLPNALEFLIDPPFLSGIADPQIRIGNYISVVTKLLFWMGLAFETPIIIALLSKIGVVQHQWLLKNWRFAIVGAYVIAAIITPTWDPINQTIVAIPLLFLYFLGILLAWVLQRGHVPETKTGPLTPNQA